MKWTEVNESSANFCHNILVHEDNSITMKCESSFRHNSNNITDDKLATVPCLDICKKTFGNVRYLLIKPLR